MKPQLLIGYDSESLSSEAACTACGEKFPHGDDVDTSPEELLIWYKALFDLHLLEKHSGGSVVALIH
jgi:hypothetical protein